MNDEELIARDREVGAKLLARPGDLDRLAGGLLKESADRLCGRAGGYLAAAAAEVRKELAANGARAEDTRDLPDDSEIRRQIRAERLLIIDRLIAIGAAGAGHGWLRPVPAVRRPGPGRGGER